MTNLSPNLEVVLQDRSLGSIPLDAGGAGFILGAQWGAVNKAMSISGLVPFKNMYGSATYGSNHISWGTIAKYLEMGVAGARIVRAGKDDSTSKNAVQMVLADSTASNWLNGTAQYRKLNAEDDTFESIEALQIKLVTDPTVAGWAIDDVVSVVGDATSYGTVDSIILAAENSSSNCFVYLKDVAGTISAADQLTDGTAGTPALATIDTAGVTDITKYGVYFKETKLTLTATHQELVGIGSVLTKGAQTGIVVGKASNVIYVSSVTDTWTTGDILSVDDITLTGSVITITDAAVVAEAMCLYAKYPGSVGNDVDVAICDATDFLLGTTYYTGTSTFLSLFESTSLATNEIAVVITLDGTVVEKWILSTDESAVRNGSSIFIDTFLSESSNYLGCDSNPDQIESFAGHFAVTSLVGGAAGAVDLQAAKDAYDVLFKPLSSVLIAGDFHDLESASNYSALMVYLAAKLASQQDMLLVGTLRKDQINPLSFDVTTSISDITAINNRWFIPCYEWEEYNNSDIRKKYWIPVTGTNVGIILRSITQYGDIEAPAGLRRGNMAGTTRLYYNLEEGSGSPVSDLYKYGVNANVLRILDSGQTGYYFWGNRTKYNPLSDMSRINVVSALLTDMKKLTSLTLPFIFEGIDEETTFASIRQTCDAGYLANRAVTAFNRLEDDGYEFTCAYGVNNDAQTVSEKTIVIDFEVKYRTAAEYINLRITVTGSGVEFQFA